MSSVITGPPTILAAASAFLIAISSMPPYRVDEYDELLELKRRINVLLEAQVGQLSGF